MGQDGCEERRARLRRDFAHRQPQRFGFDQIELEVRQAGSPSLLTEKADCDRTERPDCTGKVDGRASQNIKATPRPGRVDLRTAEVSVAGLSLGLFSQLVVKI